MPPAIYLENLRFQWPMGAALAIDAFELAQGEKLFLSGPSGSGKSTLLGLVCGIHQPQAGKLTVLGCELSQLSAIKRDQFRADHLGIIFQQFNLVPYLSVIDNVLLPRHFSKRKRALSRKEDASYWLEKLGLEKTLWTRPAHALSVGQQQRVACARALIGKPELIVADEPSSALDADNQQAFMQALLNACAETQAALLFVSHDARLQHQFDRVVSLTALNKAKCGGAA